MGSRERRRLPEVPELKSHYFWLCATLLTTPANWTRLSLTSDSFSPLLIIFSTVFPSPPSRFPTCPSQSPVPWHCGSRRSCPGGPPSDMPRPPPKLPPRRARLLRLLLPRQPRAFLEFLRPPAPPSRTLPRASVVLSRTLVGTPEKLSPLSSVSEGPSFEYSGFILPVSLSSNGPDGQRGNVTIAILLPVPLLVWADIDLNSILRAWLTIYAVLAMIPSTVYYSRVGLELGKLVFRGQNMTPP